VASSHQIRPNKAWRVVSQPRIGRPLKSLARSRIAACSSVRENNLRLRSRVRVQPYTTCTPTLALGLLSMRTLVPRCPLRPGTEQRYGETIQDMGHSEHVSAGRPTSDHGLRAQGFIWPPPRLTALRGLGGRLHVAIRSRDSECA
jgi:hypothetical protein